MKDARFTIPTPALLSRVVDMLDDIPMADRDTNGDLYEYLLSKIATAGSQRPVPHPAAHHQADGRHDRAAADRRDLRPGLRHGWLPGRRRRVRPRAAPGVLTDATQRKHFHASMFHGYDFDATMLRIGSMNMLLHGVESPDIRYRDSLSEGASGDAEKYTLILANPPFAGSLDYESTSKDLQRVVKTKKTELLFLALFLKLLKPGGRAAVIVPDGVLFGSSKAHKDLRRILVEDQKLDAVVKLPSGVFRPYAGVSTAILLFTKTNSGGTDDVWFYDVQADGFSLDDKRNPVEANDLPDVLARWAQRDDDRTRAGAHRAVVLRAEGRHRRPGLRPVPEPLQGDRPRRGRAPATAGDHRRHREAGERDRQGSGGVEGDAVVKMVPLGEVVRHRRGYCGGRRRSTTEFDPVERRTLGREPSAELHEAVISLTSCRVQKLIRPDWCRAGVSTHR